MRVVGEGVCSEVRAARALGREEDVLGHLLWVLKESVGRDEAYTLHTLSSKSIVRAALLSVDRQTQTRTHLTRQQVLHFPAAVRRGAADGALPQARGHERGPGGEAGEEVVA